MTISQGSHYPATVPTTLLQVELANSDLKTFLYMEYELMDPLHRLALITVCTRMPTLVVEQIQSFLDYMGQGLVNQNVSGIRFRWLGDQESFFWIVSKDGEYIGVKNLREAIASVKYFPK